VKKILLLSTLIVSSIIAAQSVTYDGMLNTLLKKTVDPIVANKAEKAKNALFLDTRTKREFEISHINKAQWIGYEEFKIAKLMNVPKTKEIIVYCTVGVRSEQIGEKLKKAGYSNVKNLWGGIFSWVNDGHPIIDNSGNQTIKVHAFSPEWGIWLKKGEKIYK
jgi:rhodanese-related sulfurtransferase